MTVPKLVLEPAPSELEGPLRSERDVLLHRRLDCAHYDACLDESIRRNWQGFTCLHCPVGAAIEAAHALHSRPPKRGERP